MDSDLVVRLTSTGENVQITLPDITTQAKTATQHGTIRNNPPNREASTPMQTQKERHPDASDRNPELQLFFGRAPHQART